MIQALQVKREIFPATTPEEWHKLRTQDVTSTESAALFGLSPYLTPYELWHRKKAGNIVEIDPNERMKWGTRLQDSIAAGIAADEKWVIAKRDQYERLPEQRIGASFDFTILGQEEGDGLLEIKNVDPLAMRDQWIVEDEEVEAPPHIEMQVQHQLLVSGLSYAYIGALVGGNRAVLIKRKPSRDVIQSIVDRIDSFWKSIKAGKEPKPDFSKDSKFIAKLYSSVREGRVVNMEKDAEVTQLVTAYKEAAKARDEAEERRDEAKAKLLLKIGDAEKVICQGFSISAGTVKETTIEAHTRASFRMFRVNVSKKK